jgi:hypothetical protein
MSRLTVKRNGQAMLETVLAVLCIAVVFLFLFHLTQVCLTKVLITHSCARAARARSVGFNDFMCLKSARVSVIPVSGARLWPEEEIDEVGRLPDYLASQDGAHARGILEYEFWPNFNVEVSRGFGDKITARAIIIRQDSMTVKGASEIESHYPLYLYDSGL